MTHWYSLLVSDSGGGDFIVNISIQILPIIFPSNIFLLYEVLRIAILHTHGLDSF